MDEGTSSRIKQSDALIVRGERDSLSMAILTAHGYAKKKGGPKKERL